LPFNRKLLFSGGLSNPRGLSQLRGTTIKSRNDEIVSASV